MQNRQEHRTLHGELEAAPSHDLLHHATAAALDPQPLEQQRSPDATAGKLGYLIIVEQRQNHRALRQPGGRAGEAIKITTCRHIFRASEIADDALLGLAVLANGLDQIQITVGADSLLAHEHGVSIHDKRNKSIKMRTTSDYFSTTRATQTRRQKIMFNKICRLLSRGRQIHDESVKVGLECLPRNA